MSDSTGNDDSMARFLNQQQSEKKAAQEAFDRIAQAAASGDAQAQHKLGGMYLHGTDGVARDYGRAFEWLRKAAYQGHAEAQGELGWMYIHGRGVPRDSEQAELWFAQGAAQGDLKAQSGWACSRTLEAEQIKDPDEKQRALRKAFVLLKQVAEQGDVEAQAWMGHMYLRGKGIEKDTVRALEWLGKAVEGESTFAMVELGRMHLQGKGVPVNVKHALSLYERAASDERAPSLGQLQAYEALFNTYRVGSYGGKNLNKAADWCFQFAKAWYPHENRFVLTDRKLGDEICCLILERLKNDTEIKSLELENTRIGDVTASKLAELIEENVTIEKLSLQGNPVDALGLRDIARAMRFNTVLHTVILNDDYIAEDAERTYAAALIKAQGTGNNLVRMTLQALKKWKPVVTGFPHELVELLQQSVIRIAIKRDYVTAYELEACLAESSCA